MKKEDVILTLQDIKLHLPLAAEAIDIAVDALRESIEVDAIIDTMREQPYELPWKLPAKIDWIEGSPPSNGNYLVIAKKIDGKHVVDYRHNLIPDGILGRRIVAYIGPIPSSKTLELSNK